MPLAVAKLMSCFDMIQAFKTILLTSMTAAISVTRFEKKVFAHSANSIAASKGTLDDGIKFNSYAKKSDRSCRNGVDTAIDFLE